MSEIIILAVLAVASVAMIIYSLMPSQKEQEEHVFRRMLGKRLQTDDSKAKRPGGSSAARQMLEKVAPYAMRPVMPRSDKAMSTLREKLAQAGFRRESATRYFLASKTIAAVGVAVACLLFGLTKSYPPQHLAGLLAFGGGVGFLLPNFWLSTAKRQRMEKVRNGLPDSLDLLVVSVEAGLALDGGLQKVSDEMHQVHPELSEELRIATLETQMGLPRSEALENMARRCGVAEVRTLVAVVTQAEKFGTSVAKALRTQADTLRIRRRLAAEERAQKTTVKLMIPLILFIFPSIFVVLVGPAAMRIMDAMSGSGPLAK